MCQYVVLDLEMCPVPKGSTATCKYKYKQETIQIGAVLLNESLDIIDSFNSFIKPEYGKISPYIQSLTGITYNMTKNACNFNEAMNAFFDWIPEDTTLVSWSFSDRKQLFEEATNKGLDVNPILIAWDNWIDSQKMYSEKTETPDRRYSLNEALIAADITCEGHEHDGLSDAINTAKLFVKMLKEPQLKLNPIYANAKEEIHESLSYSLSNLFGKLLAEAV